MWKMLEFGFGTTKDFWSFISARITTIGCLYKGIHSYSLNGILIWMVYLYDELTSNVYRFKLTFIPMWPAYPYLKPATRSRRRCAVCEVWTHKYWRIRNMILSAYLSFSINLSLNLLLSSYRLNFLVAPNCKPPGLFSEIRPLKERLTSKEWILLQWRLAHSLNLHSMVFWISLIDQDL